MKSLAFALLGATLLGLAAWHVWTPDLPRETLESRYASSPSSRFVTTPGLRTFVQDSGAPTAPVVVLLHGFGASLQTWDGWTDVLEHKYRVIRLDVAGFGLTGPAANGDYSDQADVRRLSDVLTALGVSRCVLLGHSMGGRIAWNFAVAHPEQVERLVLLAPDGFADPQASSDLGGDLPVYASLLRYMLPRWMVRMAIKPAYAAAQNIDPHTLTRYHDMLRAPGVRTALLERMAQTRTPDPVDKLRSLTMPVMLLWGAQDGMIPVAHAQDYLRAIPQAVLQVVPQGGHVLHEEWPDLTLKPVLDFLR